MNPSDKTKYAEQVRFPSDPRGFVVEPLGPDAFAQQRNAHLAITLPGAIRGNHYHQFGTEVALVLGPALVRYQVGEQVIDHVIAVGEAFRFTFPPGMPHAMKNPSEQPMIILSFNTHAHDPAQPDVIRQVLIEPEAS